MPPILYNLFQWPMGGGSLDPRTAMALLWLMFGTGAVFTGFFLVTRLAGRFRTAVPRALGETAVVAAVVSVAIMVWSGRLPEIWLLYCLPLPAVLTGYALWEIFGSEKWARREETAATGASGDRDGPRQQANGAMNEDEAWNLLGLSRGASAVEIKTSHRRLIKQVHPDHGGTDYLAHKINEAKKLLLSL